MWVRKLFFNPPFPTAFLSMLGRRRGVIKGLIWKMIGCYWHGGSRAQGAATTSQARHREVDAPFSRCGEVCPEK